MFCKKKEGVRIVRYCPELRILYFSFNFLYGISSSFEHVHNWNMIMDIKFIAIE